MRKPLLLIFLALTTQFTNAQTKTRFKPFKVNIALGAPVNFDHHGFIVGYEPSYSIADYKIGVRMQGAMLYMKNEGSVLLTVDRYLSHNYDFRPFFGGGLGSFNVTESGGCSGGPTAIKTVHSTAPFGGLLRTGFESRHLRVSFEYNFVADTHVTDYEASGKSLATKSYSSAYFGVTVGVNIGGGPKK